MDAMREKIQVPCPGCKKGIDTSLQEITSVKKVKCRRCGAVMEIESRYASNLRRTLQDLEKAQKNHQKAFEVAFSTAKIQLKK